MRVEMRDLWIHGRAEGGAVVVIDVFRASTTIITALERGAKEVIAVPSTEEALALHSRMPSALLMGEENGMRIPGFHLWNSPSEIAEMDLRGRTIIMRSTNGTRALASALAEKVYVAAFTNACAVAEVLRGEKDIVIYTASREDGDAIEDYLCAGMIHSLLWERPVETDIIREEIMYSPSADRLRSLGAAEDIEYCLSFCTTDIVPVCERRDGYVRCFIPG
jgi:2-phosphosulfolactate phosphatase